MTDDRRNRDRDTRRGFDPLGADDSMPTVNRGRSPYADDGIATAIDPAVPTGSDDDLDTFDPHARVADRRRAPDRREPVDPREVIAEIVRKSSTPPTGVPVTPKAAQRFDPHARIDDASRTAKFAPGPVEPVRVISHKTPGELPEKRPRDLPPIRLHTSDRGPPQDLGTLAPPRDSWEARQRSLREYALWGSLAVLVACVVTTVIWLLAR